MEVTTDTTRTQSAEGVKNSEPLQHEIFHGRRRDYLGISYDDCETNCDPYHYFGCKMILLMANGCSSHFFFHPSYLTKLEGRWGTH
jgi:hypothetical protein